MLSLKILDQELVINSKYYKEILRLLNAPSRLIGGCVRDAILGRPSIDIDITTSLPPEQVLNTLSQHNVKVIQTGIKFGGVTAIFQDEQFEITTLRKDINCTGRHAIVSFSTDFVEDARRRDFTINALSYCPFERKIYDYFHGIDHLNQKKVVFIGNPSERITEDFLRILRFFRFSAIYAEDIDQEGLLACIDLKHGLTNLSKERIKWEMDKLIILKKAYYMLDNMFSAGILQVIFPISNFDPIAFIQSINFAKEMNVELEKTSLYALLFHHTNYISHKDLINLKFSNKESTQISSMLNSMNEDKSVNIKYLLKKLWLENFNEYIQHIIILRGINRIDTNLAKEFIIKYTAKSRPKFPVSGNDLLKLDISGKAIGKNIKFLENIWIETEFTLNKEQLLKMVQNDK